jgi:hypothetical protein
MNTPSIDAGMLLRRTRAMVIAAVIICKGGTSSSPNGTRNPR